MTQVILTDIIVGSNFQLNKGRLVETDDATAQRMLADNIARKCRKNEPTEDQLNEIYILDDNATPAPPPKPKSRRPAKTKTPEPSQEATDDDDNEPIDDGGN